MIDLHMHTKYSDGDRTVKELLQLCQKKKLELISITDHNTCKAYFDEAINNKIYTGEIITGIELNAFFEGKSIEILGYDYDLDIMDKWTSETFSRENKRNRQILIHDRIMKMLLSKGLKIDKDFPYPPEGSYVEQPIFNELIKYEENRKKLGDLGSSIFEFVRKGTKNPKSEFAVKYSDLEPSAQDVINIIHKAGGISSLAHPFDYKMDDIGGFLKSIVSKTNIDGIECFHPSAGLLEQSNLILFARKHGKHITGGSDFHGILKPDIGIGEGKGMGEVYIEKTILNSWHEKNKNNSISQKSR